MQYILKKTDSDHHAATPTWAYTVTDETGAVVGNIAKIEITMDAGLAFPEITVYKKFIIDGKLIDTHEKLVCCDITFTANLLDANPCGVSG